MNGFPNLKILKSHNPTPLLKNLPLYIHTHPLTSLQCGAILQSLTNAKSLTKGQHLHAHIITSGTLHHNTYLSTKLAAFYAICGQMHQAHLIFDNILFKNTFLWNSMIRGYASNGYSIQSLSLYRQMILFGQIPDKFTYPFVLKASADLGLVKFGTTVHCEVVVSGLELDIYVSNSLLAMYSKFGDMETARTLFDRMPVRDLTSWNTMISGYVNNASPGEALVVFQLMRKYGVIADSATLLGMLSACSELAALKQGKEIHGYVVRNSLVFSNGYLINSLIRMYCSCNSMLDAKLFFDEVNWKDTVSWNCMISGYAENGEAFESLRLFCQMVLEGVSLDQVTLVGVLGACVEITALQFGLSVHSCTIKNGFGTNAIVGTALMDMYSKCGSLACTCRVFREMPEKNLVSWSAMIAGYGLYGRGREAISVFQEMTGNSIIPDEGVFTSVLSACSHAGLVYEGKVFFNSMTKEYNLKPGVAHYSCLIDLLGRAGLLNEAYEYIKRMQVKPTSDIWAALLSACRIYRNAELAELSAQKVFEMDPRGVGSYICLSNLYASQKRWDDVERVRALVRGKGMKKAPGCSFVEVDKVVHRFLVGDKSHEQTIEIYDYLKELRKQLEGDGYNPDTSSVFYDVEEKVKEKMLWDHSERLAVAFALLKTSPRTIIRITKNLRICGDCHTVTKLISKLTRREIIMRDTRRFHHFKDGVCSCGDYW